MPPPPPGDAEPDYRFTLANERTFLAWLRTALALLAAGIAVQQLGEPLRPAWARTALSLLCVLMAAAASLGGVLRWRSVQQAMRRQADLPLLRLPWLLTGDVPAAGRRRRSPPGRPVSRSGLPRVRTSLAWSRTSLSLLANAGLLLVRDPLGPAARVGLAAVALRLALGTALVARRRVDELVRARRRCTADREVLLLGGAVGALSLAVGVPSCCPPRAPWVGR